MFAKLELYADTIKSMKASQIYYRIRKMLKMNCSLGCSVSSGVERAKPIATVSMLDFDSAFLERFPADEILTDKVTFLHTSEEFHWNQKWHFDDKSALWNFNLHYFEYLLSLVNAYQTTGDRKYLDKSVEIISCWIEENPQRNGGEGWSPYTIDLRLTNWLGYYAYVNEELESGFKEKMLESIHEQYAFLSRHLEKDILGNHYFEDLKTLVLCALFFDDAPVLDVALREFRKECREEILPDGMHFELSPMYHKLILEGVIRVAVALKDRNQADAEIERYLQPMLDVAWSFEEGLERVPLFNDSGNNVTKSMQALVMAGEEYFGIRPVYKSEFENSGFYLFKKDDWKLIVDAGQPGPSYIPGHAHCDAGSFELFKAGKPVIVNCGTYAYQCKERSFFRSTAAHNTVMVNDTEQSQCWGAFRMAKRAQIHVLDFSPNSISMEITDYKKNKVKRTIQMGSDGITLIDVSQGNHLENYFHFNIDNIDIIRIYTNGKLKTNKTLYSEEYGQAKEVKSATVNADNTIKVLLSFNMDGDKEKL